jgi:hypothetical protein
MSIEKIIEYAISQNNLDAVKALMPLYMLPDILRYIKSYIPGRKGFLNIITRPSLIYLDKFINLIPKKARYIALKIYEQGGMKNGTSIVFYLMETNRVKELKLLFDHGFLKDTKYEAVYYR